MSLEASMAEACAVVGIRPPQHTKVGEWVRCQVDGKRTRNRSGTVLIFSDGNGGIAWNHVTGQEQRFSADGLGQRGEIRAPRRDPEEVKRAAAERAEVARICGRIVQACRQEPHPYLGAKGFPEEPGLVVDDIRQLIPTHDLGRDIVFRLPEGSGPWLIVPGRINGRISTVQIIGPDGAKKNIYKGVMQGAAHRIALGREAWVCEGFATALSVRAALRMLGRPATVLSAFAANNVAAVAKAIPGSIVAADHDRPLEQLHGKGTGEFYARQTGRAWTQPPELGDFNDMHQSASLRAVALHLRGVSNT